MDPATVLSGAFDGDPRLIARVLSEVENRSATGRRFFAETYARSGSAHTTGVTGAPGAGKSTLVSRLAPSFAAQGNTLAIVAVDPSSPFTGGAILGDRIRMGELASLDGVFMRSVANRGSLGGLSETTPSIVACLDGLGFLEVLVETVGVGQSEVEIATTADTTVVVVPAGWGDAVQASKAGFLEVADVLVVNKADRPEADRTVRDLQAMVELGAGEGWSPPIVTTVATEDVGTQDVHEAIASHRTYLRDSGERETRRRTQAARQVAAAMRFEMERLVDEGVDTRVIDDVAARSVDPWTAAVGLAGSQ